MAERRQGALGRRIGVVTRSRRPGGNAPSPPVEASLLLPEEKRILWFFAVTIGIALSAPFPVTKQILMVVFGFFVLSVLSKDIRLGLCLLPVLIPAQNLLPPGMIPIPGLNYETLLALLVLVCWNTQRAAFPGKSPAKTMPVFGAVLFAFLGMVLFSAAYAVLLGRARPFDLFQIYKQEWIWALVLFVMADSLRSERERKRLMVAICLSVVLLSIQPIYHGTELLAHGVSLERHRAVSLLAMQPNIYGGALAVFIPFPLVFLVRRLGGKRGRIFFGITVAVATYSLVLTLSRGSWLAMGVACIFLGFLFERRILLVLLLGIALAPLWVPQDAVNRADTMDLDEAADDDSAAVRVEQWKMIPAVLAAAPLGHGYQQFPAVYFELGGHFKGAHVGYADYAVEAGVPGLLLYVMLFVTIAVFAFGLARSGTTEFSRALGVALLGAIIAMAVAEAFGSRLKAGSVTAFLWMYAGTAVAAWRWPAEEGAGGSSPAVEPKRRGGITPRGRGRVAGAAAPTRRFAPAPEQE